MRTAIHVAAMVRARRVFGLVIGYAGAVLFSLSHQQSIVVRLRGRLLRHDGEMKLDMIMRRRSKGKYKL